MQINNLIGELMANENKRIKLRGINEKNNLNNWNSIYNN
jgi:hypothetical protein